MQWLVRKAFTLIELLVVLGILGILAAIVITAVAPNRQLVAANDAWRRSAAREILNAITQYVIEEGGLPAGVPVGSSNALPICNEGQASETGCVDLDILVTNDYLTALPVDPLEQSGALIGFTVHQAPQGFVSVDAVYLGRESGGNMTEVACNDGIDDDTDGQIDCADSNCSADAVCANCTINGTCDANEICYNDCSTEADQCGDETDNDGDGDTDIDDADCQLGCIAEATYPVTIGGGGTQALRVGTKLYTLNSTSNNVSVVSLTTDEVLSTVSVQNKPVHGALYGTKLYVANQDANSVSVINTATDTVVATVSVGTLPSFVTVVGSKVYVSNFGSHTLSVIDTATDTVSATIAGMSNPGGSIAVGTKLYVWNPTGNNIKAINTSTDTVSATISGLQQGGAFVLYGSTLYGLSGSTHVYKINTTTDTLSATIVVGGASPVYGAIVGTKLYTMNYNGSNVSVIDLNTDAVTSTIATGGSPIHAFASADESKLYVLRRTGNTVAVINTATDTISSSISMGGEPYHSVTYGAKQYIITTNNNRVQVLNLDDDSLCL